MSLTLKQQATNYVTFRHIERHNDGNIRKSIEHNGDRFKMSPQLIKIFENTADLLFQS